MIPSERAYPVYPGQAADSGAGDSVYEAVFSVLLRVIPQPVKGPVDQGGSGNQDNIHSLDQAF